MKKHLVWITCIWALAACEKDIAPSNPCDTQQETSAAFTIKEATIQQINSPNLVDFLMDTDSCYMNSVFFEAIQHDADSFIWQVGSEIEPRYGKRINVIFPDELRGRTFVVRLIVKHKPNIRCFPNDDGIDTVMRRFYFVRFNEPLSWEGTYYGSDDDKPDSMYTIVLGHRYDEVEDEDILKVFGVPRETKDTINEWVSGSLITYKNIWFQRNEINRFVFGPKIVRGVFKIGNNYEIRQEHYSEPNGVLTIKSRVFIGNKIN